MESKDKYCIVNAAIGGWYPKGQERLRESLNKVEFKGDFLSFNGWPNNNYDKSCPYNIKASAIEEAIKRGYTKILWLDCSVWAINNPEPIFKVIKKQGYYFWKNGYNCAQECSDKCLDYFGVSRDQSELWPIAATGIFGVDLNNKIGKEFIDRWLKSAKDNVFKGSRFHDGQSSDPRFLWHRQDQSAASIIASQLGCKIDDPNKLLMYDQEGNKPDSVLFLIRGM